MTRLAYGETGQDLFDLAAAYAYGVAANHPFNDANKPTAWACCALFLEINGVALEASVESVVAQMVLLASRGLDKMGFAAWLRGVVSPAA